MRRVDGAGRRPYATAATEHTPSTPSTRRYGTLADAMKHDEFRVKDIAGNENQIVYELEHEIRTLNHPGFVARRHVRREL